MNSPHGRESSPPPPRPRSPDTHKGTFGRVLLVAGSWRFPGAALLTARGALRGGAGLVTLAIPEDLHPYLATGAQAVIWHPTPTGRRGVHSLEALDPLLELAADSQAVALGPGLGVEAETVSLVHELVQALPCTLVLDADGLNALTGHVSLLETRAAPTVVTPHPGEFARLTGELLPQGTDERVRECERFARQTGAVVVLKGHQTVVSDGHGTWVNGTGNPGMATGGTGDVLTGLTAALLGQGLDVFEGTCAAVWVHGLAGDLGAAKLGEIALGPDDLIDELPNALREWTSGGEDR